MILSAIALSLLLWATPADIVAVGIPLRGSVDLVLAPAGKAELEQTGSLTRVKIEIDRLPPAQTLSPVMNTYVVWAVSPEGSFENIGELGAEGGKARFEATSRFDQMGILITAEPHYLVDLPSAIVAYRNQPPNSANVRRIPVAIQIGTYDYSNLKPSPPATAAVVAQAHAAFQLAAEAEADRWAVAEFRLARVALDTMDEMVSRATPPDILAPRANETIRRSFLALNAARSTASAAALESARNSAGVAVKLQDEFFDYRAGVLTPLGRTAMSKIVSVSPLWTSPIRIGCPAMGVNIARRFFSEAGIPDGRIVVIAN